MIKVPNIDEELVNILLSKSKIESIPDNEIIENWTMDKAINSKVTDGVQNSNLLFNDNKYDQNYLLKCDICGMFCKNDVSLKEHTLTHLDITEDYEILDGSGINKSENIDIGYKRNSPVWEFAEKLNPEQIKCKLCSHIVRTTSNITSHILRKHRDTDEGKALQLLVENKKINRINEMSKNLTPNVTENTKKLQEDMITYLGEQYHCKVCGNTEKEKHVMEDAY